MDVEDDDGQQQQQQEAEAAAELAMVNGQPSSRIIVEQNTTKRPSKISINRLTV